MKTPLSDAFFENLPGEYDHADTSENKRKTEQFARDLEQELAEALEKNRSLCTENETLKREAESLGRQMDRTDADERESGDSECMEMDGCPTERAVLKREWRAMYEILRMFQKASRDVMMPKEPRELTSKFIQSVEHRCYYEDQKKMTYAEAAKVLSPDEKKDLCITKLIDTLCELMPIIRKLGDPTTSASIGGVLHTLDGLMQGVYAPGKSPFNKPTE